uniref:Uncharacterized protein n=1 Tax=viral metagenome TaxID=1070528 RepID=A0A6M3J3V3_9ZZZZ
MKILTGDIKIDSLIGEYCVGGLSTSGNLKYAVKDILDAIIDPKDLTPDQVLGIFKTKFGDIDKATRDWQYHNIAHYDDNLGYKSFSQYLKEKTGKE